MASSFGYRAPRAPVAPRVSTSFRTQRNTGGFAEPFPSLSGQAAPRQPSVSPFRSGASLGAGYGQKVPRPPLQQPSVNPQATAQTQTAPATPTVGYSYDADPVLNQIQALGGQGREDAQAHALALRQQLAQQYGDTALAQQYGGPEQAAAASANPNSVLAQLARSYQSGQSGLEEGLNQSNLFYSGARVKQLADLAQQYQTQQAGAATQEQGALGDITSNLAAAMHAADLQDAQARQDAAARALQIALAAGGTGYPAGGGGDTGGGETPADIIAAQDPFGTTDTSTSGTWANLVPAVQNAAAVTQPYDLSSTIAALTAALAQPVSGYSAKSKSGLH